MLHRPFKPSLFFPGKVEGKPAQFLLDTGCNTNLLSKHLFDRLPAETRQRLGQCDSHGLMADGTELLFYGVLQISGWIRDMKFEDVFIISQISEDAILGLPFLCFTETLDAAARHTLDLKNDALLLAVGAACKGRTAHQGWLNRADLKLMPEEFAAYGEIFVCKFVWAMMITII